MPISLRIITLPTYLWRRLRPRPETAASCYVQFSLCSEQRLVHRVSQRRAALCAKERPKKLQRGTTKPSRLRRSQHVHAFWPVPKAVFWVQGTTAPRYTMRCGEPSSR